MRWRRRRVQSIPASECRAGVACPHGHGRAVLVADTVGELDEAERSWRCECGAPAG